MLQFPRIARSRNHTCTTIRFSRFHPCKGKQLSAFQTFDPYNRIFCENNVRNSLPCPLLSFLCLLHEVRHNHTYKATCSFGSSCPKCAQWRSSVQNAYLLNLKLVPYVPAFRTALKIYGTETVKALPLSCCNHYLCHVFASFRHLYFRSYSLKGTELRRFLCSRDFLVRFQCSSIIP